MYKTKLVGGVLYMTSVLFFDMFCFQLLLN